MVYKFFDKKSSRSGVATEPNYQLRMNVTNRLLKNSREESFIHVSKTIFGVLIWLICNH